MSKRVIVAVMSDPHGGHNKGLLNPEVVLFDEDKKIKYRPTLTPTQEELWPLYLDGIKKTKRLARRDPVVLFNNGDNVQGTYYPQELVTTSVYNQTLIGLANMMPWTSLPTLRSVSLATGTEAHTFGEGSATYLIADFFRKECRIRVDAVRHGLARIEEAGIEVDNAHHGPHPGSRVWLKGNVARFYLRDLMLEEIVYNKIPPHLVLRAHYHAAVLERLEVGAHVSWLLLQPSMCMLGFYAMKATKSPARVTNGITAIEVIDGKIREFHKFYQTTDVRTRQVL